MTIRIGANPIGWSNDDLLEIGGETPLETCLAEAREAGFVGMELGNKFPREAKALKVNMSQACERGLAAEVARARREVWLAENRAAMDAWNAHVEAHGMPLAEYRRF